MKKLIIGLLIASSLALISCESSKILKADTPTNAAVLLSRALGSNDYEAVKALFSEGRREFLTEENFKEWKELKTAGSSYVLYETITFQDGEMLLVRMTAEKMDGEYKIEDVTIVPEEMREFFNQEN